MRFWGVVLVALAGCNFPSIFGQGGDDVPDAGKDAPPPPPAMLAVAPASIALPPTGVGASRMATFTVSNPGGSTSGSISAFAMDPSVQMQSTCTTLAAQGTCVVDATFSPTMAGTLDTNIAISASPGGTVMVHLNGIAATTPNVLVLSPDPLDFGGASFTHPAPQRVVTVTNGDAVASGALSVALAPISGSFFISDTCTGAVVPAHGTCAISITYGPVSMAEDRAQLTVSGFPGGSSGEMLLGYGFNIDITPHPAAGFAFPSTAVGATASQIFTATNGTADTLGPLSVVLIPSGAPYAVIADSCTGKTLMPGASCTLGVSDAPAASGTTSVTLEVQGSTGVGGAFYFGRDVLSGTAP